MEPTPTVVVPMAVIQLAAALFTLVLWWFAFLRRPQVKPFLFLAIVAVLPAAGAFLFYAGCSATLSDLLGFTSASGWARAISNLHTLSQILLACGLLWLVVWVFRRTSEEP